MKKSRPTSSRLFFTWPQGMRWLVIHLINLFLLIFSLRTSFLPPLSTPPPVLGESLSLPALPEPAQYPLSRPDLAEPVLTASAAAILDRDSKVFLYQKNPDELRLPASTTKILTALVALDYYDPKDVIMVSRVSDIGQDMKLQNGELISVEALLYGLLVSSANDAAQILAQGYPGGEVGFVAAMNQKAASLGMERSVFTNPSGLDEGVASYSTAREMVWLADAAMENETFAKIVGTKQMMLESPQGRYFHPLYNLNQLLWTRSEVKGIKTGWTERAGECLVTMAERDGKQLVLVVLGSADRFGESEQLIDWSFENFQWVDPLQM